ncbi:MAG: ABC transporter substrate-binding protein [Actinomycetota bacterium]|nr:ABC transporter substrate-binding protein [Actinomycetota bacterium]
MSTKRWIRGLAAVAALTLIAAACGGESAPSEPTTGASGSAGPDLSGQTVEVAATWTGAEQKNFEQVLALFEDQTGATVRFLSAGDDIAAYLGPKIEGGQPPDVAILPQPGVLASFAADGSLIPIDFAGDVVDANFAPAAREVGTVDGTLYAVWFRAAQKSTVWYNTHVFSDAGVEPPATWDDMLTTAQTISDFGVAPYSVGVDVGWPLSDLFENIYLRTAGPDMYDQLAKHEIPWTDPSVKDALTKMGDVLGDSDLIAGGTSGALQTDFTGSVTQMFADPPEGAMLFEGNFVGGIITGETKSKVGPDADFFDFPSIDGSASVVVGGGDLAALLKDSEGGKELIKFLATPEAAEVWAGLGGYISPNKNVDISAYTDPIDQRAAQALLDAGDSVRYDLSDLQPTEFGATTGQGIWGILTDFVSHPDDVDGTAQQLEAAAKAAYK